jgi:hypothetical protein
MSFGLDAAGLASLIAGLDYVAHLVRWPAHWIVVSAIVLIGIGILSAVTAVRQLDPPANDSGPQDSPERTARTYLGPA